MVGPEVAHMNLLRHFHEAMLKITIENGDDRSGFRSHQLFDPEYSCLRSMMLEPQNPTMWNSMALVYMMIGRLDDALEAIDRSLDLDTGDAWTWSIWGDILGQVGDLTQSERAYRMAFQLGAREPRILNQLIHSYLLRGNTIDALQMFEYLLPLCPNDQGIWDQYTAVLSSLKT